MRSFPPDVSYELEGWDLLWFRLGRTAEGDGALDELRGRTVASVQADFEGREILSDTVLTELRRLFKLAGCNPSRYRPSPEALLRRVLKSGLPAIFPLVDLNNLLSLRLRLPCCVVNPEAIHPPFVLRAGRTGETMDTGRGPYKLDGKPVLADSIGAFETPIIDSERVRISPESSEVWLVVYLVNGQTRAEATTTLHALLDAAPVASILRSSE